MPLSGLIQSKQDWERDRDKGKEQPDDPLAEQKAKARSSLLDFVCYTMPSYEVNWHHRLFCNAIEKLLHGDCDRLMILTPPRHGKSQIVSRHLPAFILGRDPNAQIIACSYGADLASRMNRDVQRIIDTPVYREVFPDTTLNSKNVSTDARGGYLRNSEIFEIVGHKGGYRGAGVGQGITGMGFTCFVGSTKVITEIGEIPIATLIRLSPLPRVLSFNHQTQSLEWRRILATRTKPASDFVEITLHSGSQLRCTPDHPIFEYQSGYKPSGDFVPGESVIRVADVHALRTMQQKDIQGGVVQPLLSEDPRVSLPHTVCLLSAPIREAALRGRKGAKKEFQRLLLQSRLQSEASCRQKSPDVQNLRTQANSQSHEPILRELQAANAAISQGSSAERMRLLWRTLSAQQYTIGLLFKTMPESSAFGQNAGHGKQPLSRRNQLCRVVQADAPCDSSKRWRSLRGVWMQQHPTDHQTEAERRYLSSAIATGDSPYRSATLEQPSRKSCDTMCVLPQEPSPSHRQWEADIVSVVKRVCDSAEPVYDLQVEGNSNFFANGVLVHNCGIIDDPIKNREQAESVTVREGVWEWYTSTFRTRAEKGAKILICLTPWHSDDLAGRLLKTAKENPKADQWTVVKLPAIATDDLHPDDPRKPGEALWSGKYPIEDLERIRASVGPYDWQSLFQCSPTLEGGNLFDLKWLHHWYAYPRQFDRVAISLNSKFKEVSSASYVTLQVWGRSGGNYYLLDQKRDRLSFLDAKDAIAALVEKWQKLGVNINELFIEDKKNGKAILESLSADCPVTVTATNFNGDTEAGRAQAVVGLFKTGHVFIPSESDTPWVPGLLQELEDFPNAESEDQTGALTQALIYLALRQTNRPYEKFNRSTHGLRGQDAIDFAYDPSLDLHISFDWNRSPACAIAAQVRGKEVFGIKEWYLDNSDTFRLTEAVGEWIKSLGHRNTIHVHGDATGRNQTANSTQSNWDIFWSTMKRLELKHQCRKRYKDANPPEQERVISVNYLFMSDRAFVLLDQCERLVIDFENVQWTQDGKIDKKRDARLTHISDAWGYLVHDVFPYRQQGQTRTRKPSAIVGLPT